jgi:hypothetical protein
MGVMGKWEKNVLEDEKSEAMARDSRRHPAFHPAKIAAAADGTGSSALPEHFGLRHLFRLCRVPETDRSFVVDLGS